MGGSLQINIKWVDTSRLTVDSQGSGEEIPPSCFWEASRTQYIIWSWACVTGLTTLHWICGQWWSSLVSPYTTHCSTAQYTQKKKLSFNNTAQVQDAYGNISGVSSHIPQFPWSPMSSHFSMVRWCYYLYFRHGETESQSIYRTWHWIWWLALLCIQQSLTVCLSECWF